MRPRARWTFPVVLSLLAAAAPAQEAGQSAAPPVKARLLLEHASLVAGAANSVGVLLELPEGWHTYAACLNDSGLPVSIEPELPEGWAWRATEPPAPVRHLGAGDMLDHVYEGRVLLPALLDVPAGAAAGTLVLKAHVSWLLCREACVLGDADVSAVATVVPAGTEVEVLGKSAPMFTAARARTPKALPARDAPATASIAGNALRIDAPGATGLAFYPDADGPAFADLLHEGATEGHALAVRLAEDATGSVRGVLELRWPGNRPADFYRIDVPLPDSPAPGRDPRAPPSQETDDAR